MYNFFKKLIKNRKNLLKFYKFRYFLAYSLLKNNPRYVIIDMDKEKFNTIKYTNVIQKSFKKSNYKKENEFMCKASEIGKIIVNKCLQLNLDINTQKLQKLLVLIQVECIKQSGFPFFAEDIRVWDCGVAIKEVDEDFRQNGTRFCSELDENITLLDSEEEYIDTILNKFGNLTASELNDLSTNQRVIKLGQINEGDTVPHISAVRLVEEFAQ